VALSEELTVLQTFCSNEITEIVSWFQQPDASEFM